MNSDNGEKTPFKGVEIDEETAVVPPEGNPMEQGFEQPAVTDLQPDPVQAGSAESSAEEGAERAAVGEPVVGDHEGDTERKAPSETAAAPEPAASDAVPGKAAATPGPIESASAGEDEAVEGAETPASAREQQAPAASETAPVPDGQPEQPAESLQTSAGAGTASATAEGKTKLKWYVVHVYSGYEQKARRSLLERIKQAGMESNFGEILIPTETVQETRGKSSRITTKTFYPGYIFVQMSLNDNAWHLVRDTPKITGFVGGRYPRPVPAPEIASVVQQVEEGAAKPRPQVQFEQGDQVRVIDGAFANFTGAVEDIKPEKQKVRVLVSIFGRATPVELDYSQVEKTA